MPSPTPSRSTGAFTACEACGGSGQLTTQRSGDWRRDPDHYRPDQMVVCRICGGTGLIPRPGAFEEA